MDDFITQVFAVASTVLKVPISLINQHSSPQTLPAWTSFTQMNLMLALERKFSLTFTARDLVEMNNMELILVILAEKLGRC